MNIVENTYELLAISVPVTSKYGRYRFALDNYVAIDDKGEIDVKSDSATHKIVGIYSTIGSENAVLILVDVITKEPLRLVL